MEAKEENAITPIERRDGKTLHKNTMRVNERTANKNNEQNSKAHATRPSTNKNKK